MTAARAQPTVELWNPNKWQPLDDLNNVYLLKWYIAYHGGEVWS